MLTQETARKVLSACLTTGADFAEIFFENTLATGITLLCGKADTLANRHEYGAGLRLLCGEEEAYGYTSDCSEAGLLALAKKLRGSFEGTPTATVAPFSEEDASGKNTPIRTPSDHISHEEKIALLRKVDESIREYDPRILQRILRLNDRTQRITIANNLGKFAHDLRNQQRITLTVVAKEGEKNQSFSGSVGGNFGIEGYAEKDLFGFAEEICHGCLTMLNAPQMVGGVYPVIINNGFGGVLFHEACGHSLEATAVAKGLSVFCGKKGERIASELVTAVDDGTLQNEWGTTNIDDEGNPTRRNVLIENGILKGYLVDYRNGRRMKEEPTGSSRRESYRYSPTSRMNNTYIQNGTSTVEEIIAATEYGLFAKSMGGGSVNPTTGEFNFAVNEGYMVEHGKITHPVRGATLIGNGADILMDIDMVANNQSFGHGVCGSASGSVPANVGQPTLRIRKMTVGGSGKADEKKTER